MSFIHKKQQQNAAECLMLRRWCAHAHLSQTANTVKTPKCIWFILYMYVHIIKMFVCNTDTQIHTHTRIQTNG